MPCTWDMPDLIRYAYPFRAVPVAVMHRSGYEVRVRVRVRSFIQCGWRHADLVDTRLGRGRRVCEHSLGHLAQQLVVRGACIEFKGRRGARGQPQTEPHHQGHVRSPSLRSSSLQHSSLLQSQRLPGEEFGTLAGKKAFSQRSHSCSLRTSISVCIRVRDPGLLLTAHRRRASPFLR